jgi:hypothetical protein
MIVSAISTLRAGISTGRGLIFHGDWSVMGCVLMFGCGKLVAALGRMKLFLKHCNPLVALAVAIALATSMSPLLPHLRLLSPLLLAIDIIFACDVFDRSFRFLFFFFSFDVVWYGMA